MPGHSDKRRTVRGNRPAGRSGPGRSASGRPSRGRGLAPEPVAPTVTASRPPPRLTSRAAILVVIVAVLAVSYASSLRAYLQQRSHLDDQRAAIAESERSIAAMEQELERLDDPAYVEQQARARFGYVMPGEKPFVVLDDGEPLEPEGTLGDPGEIDHGQPPAWYDDAWQTVLVAGDPPRRVDPPPLTRVSPDDAEESGE